MQQSFSCLQAAGEKTAEAVRSTTGDSVADAIKSTSVSLGGGVKGLGESLGFKETVRVAVLSELAYVERGRLSELLASRLRIQVLRQRTLPRPPRTPRRTLSVRKNRPSKTKPLLQK